MAFFFLSTASLIWVCVSKAGSVLRGVSILTKSIQCIATYTSCMCSGVNTHTRFNGEIIYYTQFSLSLSLYRLEKVKKKKKWARDLQVRNTAVRSLINIDGVRAKSI